MRIWIWYRVVRGFVGSMHDRVVYVLARNNYIYGSMIHTQRTSLDFSFRPWIVKAVQ